MEEKGRDEGGVGRGIRALLADGQPVRRLGVRLLLDGDPEGDLEVVGEGSSADEVLGLAREEAPDVVVLDPGLDPPGGSAWLCLALKFYGGLRPPAVVLYGGAGDVPGGEVGGFYELSGAESFVEAAEENGTLVEAIRRTCYDGERVFYGA